jgi:hypothetical protein
MCRALQIESIAVMDSSEPGVASISSRDALNIDIRAASSMTQLTQDQLDSVTNLKLTVSQKQATLQRLQEDMWLGEDGKGNITIGVRVFPLWLSCYYSICTCCVVCCSLKACAPEMNGLQ